MCAHLVVAVEVRWLPSIVGSAGCISNEAEGVRVWNLFRPKSVACASQDLGLASGQGVCVGETKRVRITISPSMTAEMVRTRHPNVLVLASLAGAPSCLPFSYNRLLISEKMIHAQA